MDKNALAHAGAIGSHQLIGHILVQGAIIIGSNKSNLISGRPGTDPSEYHCS